MASTLDCCHDTAEFIYNNLHYIWQTIFDLSDFTSNEENANDYKTIYLTSKCTETNSYFKACLNGNILFQYLLQHFIWFKQHETLKLYLAAKICKRNQPVGRANADVSCSHSIRSWAVHETLKMHWHF